MHAVGTGVGNAAGGGENQEERRGGGCADELVLETQEAGGRLVGALPVEFDLDRAPVSITGGDDGVRLQAIGERPLSPDRGACRLRARHPIRQCRRHTELGSLQHPVRPP